MESLDQILQRLPDFEPSRATKQQILGAVKQEHFKHQGLEVEVPSFFSIDVDAYRKIQWAPIYVYALELFALGGILMTKSNSYFLLGRIVAAISLMLFDFFIARVSNSKMSMVVLSKYRNARYDLIRKFFSRFISNDTLAQIAKNYSNEEKKKVHAEAHMKLMTRLLWGVGLLKIAAFYSEILVGSLGFGDTISMYGKDTIYLFFFIGSPIVYLIIPVVASKVYGPWFSTKRTFESLADDEREHKEAREVRQRDVVGAVKNWRRKEIRQLTFSTLISSEESAPAASTPTNPSMDMPMQQRIVPFTDDISRDSYKVFQGKDSAPARIEVFGILTDNDLQTMVSNQTDIDAKRLILCIGMSIQISCSDRDGDSNVGREEPEPDGGTQGRDQDG